MTVKTGRSPIVNVWVMKSRVQEFVQAKTKLAELLEIENNKLNSLPDVTIIKQEADTGRGLHTASISVTGKRDKCRIDHYMYGKIKGLRTLKDNDINYQGDHEENITNTEVKR